MIDYPTAIFLGLVALGGMGWLLGSLYKLKKKKKEKQVEDDACSNDCQNIPDVYLCDIDSAKNQALYEAATEKFMINLMGIVALHEMTGIADRQSSKATTWEAIDINCHD